MNLKSTIKEKRWFLMGTSLILLTWVANHLWIDNLDSYLKKYDYRWIDYSLSKLKVQQAEMNLSLIGWIYKQNVKEIINGNKVNSKYKNNDDTATILRDTILLNAELKEYAVALFHTMVKLST